MSNREIDRKVRHQAQSKPKFVQELPEESSGKNGDIVYFKFASLFASQALCAAR